MKKNSSKNTKPKIVIFVLYLLISQIYFCTQSSAQGLGNIGGVIEPAGLREPYGINDQNILQSQDYLTRNSRRGNESGIGGSFLQTTSPTNGSSPAIRAKIVSPTAQKEIKLLPKLPTSMYGNIEQSPALNIDLSQSSSNTYSEKQRSTSSPALTNPVQNPPSLSDNESLLKIPVIEPLQQLNKHPTGGANISFP